jgi:ribosome-binding factor A
MESTRQKKVGKLIQKELADIFLRRAGEIAPGLLVSITVVRVSPDLALAKVYLSVFPAEKQESTLASIRDHSHKLRHELGQKVRNQLRIVPELAFFTDDSFEYIDNIEKLLKK